MKQEERVSLRALNRTLNQQAVATESAISGKTGCHSHHLRRRLSPAQNKHPQPPPSTSFPNLLPQPPPVQTAACLESGCSPDVYQRHQTPGVSNRHNRLSPGRFRHFRKLATIVLLAGFTGTALWMNEASAQALTKERVCEVLEIDPTDCALISSVSDNGNPWVVENDVSRLFSGEYLISAEGLTGSMASCLSLNFAEGALPADSRIDFYWREDNRAGRSLSFYINGVETAVRTGGSWWRQQQRFAPSPVTELRWCFERSGEVSDSNGFGTLDRLSFHTGADAPLIADNAALCRILDIADCNQINSFSQTNPTLSWRLYNGALAIPWIPLGGEMTCLEVDIDIAGRQTVAFEWRLRNAAANSTLSVLINGSERQTLTPQNSGTGLSWLPVILSSDSPIDTLSWCYAVAESPLVQPFGWVRELRTGIAALSVEPLSEPVQTAATAMLLSYQFALTVTDPSGAALPAELSFQFPAELNGIALSFTSSIRSNPALAANQRQFDITAQLMPGAELLPRVEMQFAADLIADYTLTTDNLPSIRFNLFEHTRMRFCEAMELEERQCQLITGIESNEYPWQLTDSGTFSGSGLQSFADLQDNQYSLLTLTLAADVRAVSFFRRVSSELPWDWLIFEYDEFRRDGNQLSSLAYRQLPFFDGGGTRVQGDISGTVNSYRFGNNNQNPVNSAVNLGPEGRYSLLQLFPDEPIRELRWIFDKDSSNSAGEDRGWIDSLRFLVPVTAARSGAALCEALDMRAQDCISISSVTTTAEYPWHIPALGLQFSGNYLRSALEPGDDSASSCLTMHISPPLPAATRIDFAWRNTSGSEGDVARFHINDMLAAQTGSTLQWHYQQRLSENPVNSLSWCYQRRSDGAFPHHQGIDQLQFTAPAEAQPEPAALCEALDIPSANCQTVTFSHQPPILQWRISTAQSVAGASSLQIPLTVLTGEQSCLELAVAVEAGESLSFNWRIATADGTRLRFLIDGSETAALNGDGSDSGWRSFSHSLSAAIDSLSWCYSNNGPADISAQAWLDNLVRGPLIVIQAISTPVLVQAESDGNRLTYNFEVRLEKADGTALEADRYALDFAITEHSADHIIRNLSLGDQSVAGSGLVLAVTVAVELVNLVPTVSWEEFAVFGLPSTAHNLPPLVAPVPLKSLLCTALALSSDDCRLILSVENGARPWQITGEGTFSGLGLSSAPNLPHNAASTLTFSLAPTVAAVEFQRRVSSEERWDWLIFEYNEFQRGENQVSEESYRLLPFFDPDGTRSHGDISGNANDEYSFGDDRVAANATGPLPAWSRLQLLPTDPISITELRWIYRKDSRNSRGQDRAWIDNLQLHPALTTSAQLCSALDLAQQNCPLLNFTLQPPTRLWTVDDETNLLAGGGSALRVPFGVAPGTSACLTASIDPVSDVSTDPNLLQFRWRLPLRGVELSFRVNGTEVETRDHTSGTGWGEVTYATDSPVNTLSWCHSQAAEDPRPSLGWIDTLSFRPLTRTGIGAISTPTVLQSAGTRTDFRFVVVLNDLTDPQRPVEILPQLQLAAATPTQLMSWSATLATTATDNARQFIFTVIAGLDIPLFEGSELLISFISTSTVSVDPVRTVSLPVEARERQLLCSALELSAANCALIASFSSSASFPWQLTDDQALQGTALQSNPALDDSAGNGVYNYSILTLTLSTPISGLQFYWRVDSEEDFDLLIFEIDNIRYGSSSGPSSTYRGLSREITDDLGRSASNNGYISGEFTRYASLRLLAATPITELRWLYRKDSSVSDGRDRGWLERLNFFVPVTDVARLCDILDMRQADCERIESLSTTAGRPWSAFTSPELRAEVLRPFPNYEVGETCLTLQLSSPLPAGSRVDLLWRVHIGSNPARLVFRSAGTAVAGDSGTDSFYPQQRFLPSSSSELQWCFFQIADNGNFGEYVELDQLRFIDAAEAQLIGDTGTLCEVLDIPPGNCRTFLSAYSQRPGTLSWLPDTSETRTGGSSLRVPNTVLSDEQSCIELETGQLASQILEFDWRLDSASGSRLVFSLNNTDIDSLVSDGSDSGWLSYSTDTLNIADRPTNTLAWCYIHSTSEIDGKHLGWVDSLGFGALLGITAVTTPTLQNISGATGIYRFEVTVAAAGEQMPIVERQLQRLEIQPLRHSDNIAISASEVSSRRRVDAQTVVLTAELQVQLQSFQAGASLMVDLSGGLIMPNTGSDSQFDVSELFIPAFCQALELSSGDCELVVGIDTATEAPWQITTSPILSGTALQSYADLGDSPASRSILTVTVSPEVRGIAFHWRVSSAAEDPLTFLAGDVERERISGTAMTDYSPVNFLGLESNGAESRLQWIFEQTSANPAGSNRGWLERLNLLVDDARISIISTPQQTMQLGGYRFGVTVVHPDGTSAVPDAVSLAISAAVNLMIHSITSTTTGTMRQFSVTLVLPTPAAEASLSVGLSGSEIAEPAQTVSFAAWSIADTLCTPLDISDEDCDLISSFSTTADYPWQVVTAAAFQSGENLLASADDVADNAESCLTLEFSSEANSVGRIDFSWAVDSESTDRLQLSIGEQVRAFNSGLLAAAPHERQQRLLTPPLSTLSWCYVKDATGSTGEDRGWLDSLSFHRDEAAILLPADRLCSALDLDSDSCDLIAGFRQQHSGNGTGGLSWALTEAESVAGVSSLRSPLTVPENGESCLILIFNTELPSTTELRFQWQVDSALNTDFLRLRIDSTVISSISGELASNPWSPANHTLTEATDELAWCFDDTGPASAGRSSGWIDQLQLFPPLPQFAIAAVTTITAQPVLGRYQFTVAARDNNQGFRAALLQEQLALTTTRHRNIATYTVADTVSDNGDKLFAVTIQLQAIDTTGNLTVALDHPDPTLLAPVDSPREFSFAALTVDQSICMTLDLSSQDCNFISGFATTPEYPWQIAEAGFQSGENLLASADGVADSMQSCLILTLTENALTARSRIDFNWAVDSAAGDNLQFAFNEVDTAGIAGLAVPLHRQQRFSHTAVNSLRWCYSKDAAGSAGEDRGWLDTLSFQPAAEAILLADQQALCTALDLSAADCAAISSYSQTPSSLSWGITSDIALQGGSSLQNPATATSGESTCLRLQIDLPADTIINFAWRVDSADSSAFSFEVNDTAVAGISIQGAVSEVAGNGWQIQNYRHETALRALAWCYRRGAMFAGAERGWLDQLSLEPAFNYPLITLETTPTRTDDDSPWVFDLRVTAAAGTTLPPGLQVILALGSNVGNIELRIESQTDQNIELQVEATTEDDSNTTIMRFGFSGLPVAVEPLADGLTVVIEPGVLTQVVPVLQALADDSPATDGISLNDLLTGLNVLGGGDNNTLNNNLPTTNTDLNDDINDFTVAIDDPQQRGVLDVDSSDTVDIIDFRLMVRYYAGLRGTALCDEVCIIKLRSLLER